MRHRKQFPEPDLHVVCGPGPGQARGGHVARGGGEDWSGDSVQLLRVQGESSDMETSKSLHSIA